MPEAEDRSTVVVAGASGFIGQALAQRLAGRHRLVGLSRAPRTGDGYDEWRACDFFSLRDAEQALEGARYAVYLVHSMMPSARLVQGRFEDLDLICADNFGRAARSAGVEQIIYLGGLVPDDEHLSAHLESRREVEVALGGHGVPVTTLRAGLVIGAGGSSFVMMLRLVRRLPMMVCPSWTRTTCQPIALDDVTDIITYCLGRAACFGGTYDIGGPDVLSYRDMMLETAEVLGVRRPTLPVPVISPGLSRLWITAITGAPKELVAPLIQSLAHSMVTGDRRLQAEANVPGIPFREAIARALDQEARSTRPSVQKPLAYAAPRAAEGAPRVRSVQRLPRPPGKDAAWVAAEYVRWLPTGLWPILRLSVEGRDAPGEARVCRFYLARMRQPLLELTFAPGRSAPDRQLFYITGGLLVVETGRGRLEFRETPDGRSVLAAIHDYRPRLPWRIYESTQARFHLLVMHAFGSHLARVR
jgi:uncharacterized protein YbjT (DUF2867 family)